MRVLVASHYLSLLLILSSHTFSCFSHYHLIPCSSHYQSYISLLLELWKPAFNCSWHYRLLPFSIPDINILPFSVTDIVISYLSLILKLSSLTFLSSRRCQLFSVLDITIPYLYLFKTSSSPNFLFSRYNHPQPWSSLPTYVCSWQYFYLLISQFQTLLSPSLYLALLRFPFPTVLPLILPIYYLFFICIILCCCILTAEHVSNMIYYLHFFVLNMFLLS